MIIINQDKKKIINFERITEIIASGTKILVRDDIFLPEGEEIAKYETEERAKEVLQEIIRALIEAKKLESADSMFGFGIISANTVYEMPER